MVSVKMAGVPATVLVPVKRLAEAKSLSMTALLAPSDAAFAALGPDSLSALLTDVPRLRRAAMPAESGSFTSFQTAHSCS